MGRFAVKKIGNARSTLFLPERLAEAVETTNRQHFLQWSAVRN
jgi:hypothetical protein